MLTSLKLIFLQYEYKCTTICFNDNGLYLHFRQLADRIVGLWQIVLSSNICAWLLGGQMSKVHLQTGLMSSTGNGKAVACRSFPFWHSYQADRWEKSDAAYLWMELARLHGTLIVLENLIHMAPCTAETSDDQETVCQENNNSNLFHRIAQDIIIIAVGIPKVIWLWCKDLGC